MRILVCSRISIPDKDRTLPAWEHLRSLGHEVVVEHPDSVPTDRRPDAMISMGVSIMEETFRALERFPGVPLFAYNWDCYEWVWEPCGRCGGFGTIPDGGMAGGTCPKCKGVGRDVAKQAFHASRGREYDYVRYGELLRLAAEVWVPSACTGWRSVQWWGLDPRRIEVVLSSCPWWDHPNVHDGGYALCTLRHIPDPWDTMFERCCGELEIPFRRTDHELSHEEYRDVVAGCRFMVSHYYEASTGGLTLTEAYRLGKPVLVSDSRWHGGRDYFGDRAFYFRFGDLGHFKSQLLHLHHGRVAVEPDHKEWVETNYSDRVMVERMLDRIGRVLCSARG